MYYTVWLLRAFAYGKLPGQAAWIVLLQASTHRVGAPLSPATPLACGPEQLAAMLDMRLY